MPVEAWKSFFDVGAVIAAFLAFAFGAGVLITGNIINDRQATELRDFQARLEGEQQKTAKAQEDAARAQLELRKYIEQVGKQAGPRMLSPKFAEALKGKPTGTVDILYTAEDMEAYKLALQMWHALKDAGWAVAPPRSIPGKRGLPGKTVVEAPTQFRYGVGAGMLLVGKSFPEDGAKPTAASAIREAIGDALEIPWSCVFTTDPSLPADHFEIAIGQKQ